MNRQRNRRSIRLKEYDYSQPGAYFVTVCTQDRVCLFGDVSDGQMRLNDAGRMVKKWWTELNRKFANVQTDEYVIMPNHFHGIIVIQNDPAGVRVGADLRVCSYPMGAPMTTPAGQSSGHVDQSGAHAGAPLPKIVQWFKTMTTNGYIRGVKQFDWPGFNGRLWQRNYYEHIIRNEESLNRIRQYICDNPARWKIDRENPANLSTPKPHPTQLLEDWA